jgi:RNA polymerase sigma-70 factor, ECF subfamily
VTDQDIHRIRAWQAGEEDAARTLFVLYFPKIVRLAVAGGLSPEDAKDCAQETFVQAYVARAQLRDPAAFPAWFYRIFAHRLTEALRRRRFDVVPLDLHDSLQGKAQPEVASPEDQVIQAEEAREIRRRVWALPISLRIPLILRYYGELSFQEIARIIGKREGTIRVRIHRALRQLRLEDHTHLSPIEDLAAPSMNLQEQGVSNANISS